MNAPEESFSISGMADKDLPSLLNLATSRQLLHITYGKIMNETNPDGSLRFKDRLYRFWREHRAEYDSILERHMDRHLSLLMPHM